MIKFEFDDVKSRSNLDKHSVGFHTAQGLWNDSDLIEIPANTSDAPRFLVIGLLDGKHWSAVITYRGRKIWGISVRRLRKAEVSLYESA